MINMHSLHQMLLCLLMAGVVQPALPVARGSADAPAAFWVQSQAWPPSVQDQYKASITGAGYQFQTVSLDALTNASLIDARLVDLLVLPQADEMPYSSIPVLDAFLKAGGKVMAFGAPAWESGLFPVNGRWMTRAAYEGTIATQSWSHAMIDFSREDLSKWTRHTGQPQPSSRMELAKGESGQVFHAIMDNMVNWDTFASPALTEPFAQGHSLTCFRAKGGPATSQLALEWAEKDGSRWIATIGLTTNWQYYALPPARFLAWQPPASRGGRGDTFQPRNAVRFTAGLAMSHTSVAQGPHEFWLDNVGSAPNPFGESAPSAEPALPHWETLCPGYLFYPVTTPVRLTAAQAFAPKAPFQPAPPSSVLAMHPRPGGAGFLQDRPWRWQPLLEAWSPEGDYRGAIASLLIHTQGPNRGGVWISFTPREHGFYSQQGMAEWIGSLATAIRRGSFLLEGGTEFFTVFENQAVKVGGRIMHTGPRGSGPLRLRLRAYPAGSPTPADGVGSASTPKPEFEQSWDIQIGPGAEKNVQAEWTPSFSQSRAYRIVTELMHEDQVIDSLSHELRCWKPKDKPEFIEAREGGFWLGGKPWKAHGVNYMPSSGIAVPSAYFEYWLGKGAYDPTVIQRDLARIQGMGMNAVSAFVYYQSLSAQHLLDFLSRCEALGLRVNLSLRPGTPMDFRWTEMKALIEHYRMASNDTIFAYDMAWEPSHFDEAHQQRYAPLWNDWVLKHHGSMEGAKKAWDGYPLDSANSGASLRLPKAKEWTRDGPWRKYVAGYRRFLDELLHENYAQARQLVRSVDPHHPVSFRMQFSGDPTFNSAGLLPYDFMGLAGAVDIWEPEAYGRIGGWEQVKPGHFSAAYARLCDPAKPVLWAEMGNSVWDIARMASSPDKMEFTARYYADFYRMLRESGADGIFFWWYPGGFRLYENSDYGIINPDGTDRAITRVIREEGARFLQAPKPPASDVVLPVNRDQDARGLPGIYDRIRARYWDAADKGRMPALRLEP